jgi:ABC-type sugar transport system substrate-binding protein
LNGKATIPTGFALKNRSKTKNKTKGETTMKKLIALLLTLVMVIPMVACGGSTNDSASDSKADDTNKDIVIGMAMNTLDDYQTAWYAYLEKFANEAGVKIIMTNAEGKVDKQLADVESLIANNCDLILIRATDSAGIVSAFEACAEAGIPTIDSGFGSNYDDTLKIISSQIYLCNLQADYCLEWLEEHPDETLKCGYIWGAQGTSSTQERYDGWHDRLMENANGRAEILAEKVCNWSATETMAAVEDWVQAYPEMNCIVAMSDEMALAASNVLQAAGIGTDKCIVIGIDGSDAAQEALRAGTLNATVYTSKAADAKLTFEYAIRVANGEDLNGQTIDPGNEISALMVADNIDELLETLG